MDRYIAIALLAVAILQHSAEVTGVSWRFDNTTSSYLRVDSTQECSEEIRTVCDGCYKSMKCLKMGDDDFIQIEGETCTGGDTCKHGKGCQNEDHTGCGTQNQKFICKMTGVFPDPFDCKKFHYCPPEFEFEHEKAAKPVQFSIPDICDKGYAYDALTTLCKIRLADDKCPVVDLCKHGEEGTAKALSIGSSYFFVCNKRPGIDGLYPYMYRCLRGGMFFKDSCVDPDNESSTSTPSVEVEKPMPPGVEVETQTPPNGAIVCEAPGLLANEDCRSYYQCRMKGDRPSLHTCPPGAHFDKTAKICKRGMCMNY